MPLKAKLIKYLSKSTILYFVAYMDETKVENRVDCDFDHPPPEGKVCNVPATSWDPCTAQKKYNFPKSSPCIFLKLNKVRFFMPYSKY